MGPMFGKYEVLSRLGVGGMGEVFRAREAGRQVALKLIRPELATEERFRRMFESEGRIASRLEHPHLVRTFDYGEVDGVPFLATELVEGAALDQVMAGGPLSPPAVAHVVGALLGALGYAHTLTGDDGRPLGLVHRDVSPQNVLVSRDGEVKLADFGLVKLDGPSLTLSHELKGKLDYLAPERLPSRAGGVDRRADLFSVGVILHELATGRRPFEDLERWIAAGAPLDVAGPLEPVLRRALAVEPEARFASAELFATALAACLPPSPEGGAELAARVARLPRTERPLEELERRLMAELDPLDEPSVLIYAPDPSSQWLWSVRPASQVTALGDEGPTNQWRFASSHELPTVVREPGAAEPAETVQSPLPAWWQRPGLVVRLAAALTLLVLTMALVALVGQPSVPPR